MKAIKCFRLMGLALSLIGLSALWNPARATETAAGNSIIVPYDRPVNDDLAVTGSNVEVQARITGNVTAAGANVRIAGPVGNSLYAAGSNVTVDAPIAGNVMLVGSEVALMPAASVGRDAHLAGATVRVQAPIKRNLVIGAAEAVLSSEVGGSVEARAEHLILEPGAVIRGNLTVSGPNAPEISPQARVLGRTDYHKVESPRNNTGPGSGAGWWLFRFLSLLLLGTVAMVTVPIWVNRVAMTIVQQTGQAVLAGFLGLFLVPIVSLILMFTLIGLPLGLLLLAVYFISLLLSGVFVSALIGGWLLKRWGHSQASPYARFVLGALIVSILSALPWIGWLMEWAIMILGFGAWLLERRDLFLRLRAEGLA